MEKNGKTKRQERNDDTNRKIMREKKRNNKNIKRERREKNMKERKDKKKRSKREKRNLEIKWKPNKNHRKETQLLIG